MLNEPKKPPIKLPKGYEEQLKLTLQKLEAFERIYKNQDVQEHLIPVLEEIVSNDNWLDPRSYKTDEAFKKAYLEEYFNTLANKGLLSILENAQAQALSIKEQLTNPQKDFKIV